MMILIKLREKVYQGAAAFKSIQRGPGVFIRMATCTRINLEQDILRDINFMCPIEIFVPSAGFEPGIFASEARHVPYSLVSPADK